MKYEEAKKLLNYVIDNEFTHLTNDENYFCDNNPNHKEILHKGHEAWLKFSETLSEEQRKLFQEYDFLLIEEVVSLEKLYFKLGVRAGLTNLKFLNEVIPHFCGML